MLSQLTRRERYIGFYQLVAIGLVGLFFMIAGRHDPIATHGLIIVLFSVMLGWLVYRSLPAIEPNAEANRDNDITIIYINQRV